MQVERVRPMASAPRMALLTSGSSPDPSVACLTLLAALSATGWKVQHFRSRACPVSRHPVGPITGLPGRHVDSWLMAPAICRSVFLRGSRHTDLSLIEGFLKPLTTASEAKDSATRLAFGPELLSGPIDQLLDILNLPAIAVVDCGGSVGSLSAIPAQAEAVLLDGVRDRDHYLALRDQIQEAVGIPAVGGIEELTGIRAGLAGCPPGRPVPRNLLDPLVRSLVATLDWGLLSRLVQSRPFPHLEQDGLAVPAWLLSSREPRFRIAYAQDDAFDGYFPETLEALELLGADLVDFSPLRSELLPPGSDLVMIGSGFPESHARQLSSNVNLIAQLQAHVYAGRRIYAEEGGLAYLARSMVIDGCTFTGAGILNLDAVFSADRIGLQPVEHELAKESWLAPRGSLVRGYRSSKWKLEPERHFSCTTATVREVSEEQNLVYNLGVIGSLLHLNISALPDIIAGFAGRGRGCSGRKTPLPNETPGFH